MHGEFLNSISYVYHIVKIRHVMLLVKKHETIEVIIIGSNLLVEATDLLMCTALT